ncbi:bifunctional hydroxymethylpyrimidine kinase/phosphomethylpyrimidine kinase [Halobaculum sp. EA56]|uniref:bifunctional hydroxymethylpyrimidine kinase/phosphomethylpyrimidine kinase n=1 Tax=Halobaculum sp. EA56 TaxID=3421648 RepID=UPI003EB9449F
MTRRPSPDARPVGLTVAGSDSGGGAGIQADLKTMEAHGAFGTSVVTSVTAQHTRGVESTHVLPVGEVTAQFDAVVDDFDVRAAKTGMLATAPIVEAVTERARDLDAPLVVDPVMVAASGDRLLDPEAESAYEDLVAAATLVTPNADEAAVLTGVEPTDRASMGEAGRRLVDMGADAALVTGGHVDGGAGDGEGGGDEVADVFVTADDVRTFVHPRVDTDATHGSGCTLSSAAVARLAHGDPLSEAVEAAVEFLARAVRYPLDVGQGPGAVHHLVGLREAAARDPVREAVEGVVERLVAADARPLVPEVGLNVVGATPYAETSGETAAVEGRITRTSSGVRDTRGVRFGASSHVARLLLAAREVDPALRFGANCRFDDDVEAALADLGWEVVEFDREAEPDAGGGTMDWAGRRALEAADGTPDAVVDRGAVGKEPMARVLATDAEELADDLAELADALR